MSQHCSKSLIVVGAALLCGIGCGGVAQSPPKSPEPSPVPAAAAETPANTAPTPPAAAAPGSEGGEQAKASAPGAGASPSTSSGAAAHVDSTQGGEAPASEPTRGPSEMPKEIIGAPKVVFLIDFANSDAKQTATAKCEEKVGDDPEKLSQCVGDVRAKIKLDGHRFKKDPSNKWWWLVYERRGDTLLTLHKVQFDFGEETDHSIILKPKGKDQGMAPWTHLPQKLVVEVPNTYSIVMDDAEFGKLRYNAKVGLTDD